MSTDSLYDTIGLDYDVTRRPDPYLLSHLVAHVAINPAGRYLDVACGTGNYTSQLAALGGHWYGLDQSARMLDEACEKTPGVTWCQGDVANQPFSDGIFQGAVCALAMPHFAALEPAFAEVQRVLSSGRFVIFTSTAEQMQGYWLNAYFPRAMARSIEQMPGRQEIADALGSVGFQTVTYEPYEVREDLQDGFLYIGKHRPEIYLSAAVRRGISTFAVLADTDEIEAGCLALRVDIRSGRIRDVMSQYAHPGGDYLFVIATSKASDTISTGR